MSWHIRNPASAPRHQRGVAAIELGILIVPLLMMLFGVTEFGRAIYQYNTLVKSVRDASRYLSVLDAGNGHVEAACLAVHGNTACTGPALLPGLTTGMVSICDANNCPSHAGQPFPPTGTAVGSANLVTVTVSGYVFQPIFGSFSTGLVGGGNVTIGMPGITFDPIFNTMRQS